MFKEIKNLQESTLNTADQIEKERDDEIKKHLVDIESIGFNRINNKDYSGYSIKKSFNGKAIKHSDLKRINEIFDKKLEMIYQEKNNKTVNPDTKDGIQEPTIISEVAGESEKANKIERGAYESQKAEIEKRIKEAKDVHDNSVLTAADSGFVVKESKDSYETAKDLRSFIQKQSTADEIGVIYKFKNDDNIYNYAISTYDHKRGAGIGYVGYSVKVDKNTSLTDDEIYAILENNLDAAVNQKFPNIDTWKTDKDTNINSVEKNSFEKINAKYDTELAELDKKFGKDAQPEETLAVENTEEKLEGEKDLKEKDEKQEKINTSIETLTALIAETNKLKEKLAQLIEARNLSEQQEKNSTEELKIKELDINDLDWSYPNYIDRVGRLDYNIDDNHSVSILMTEKLNEEKKRNKLGRIWHHNSYKLVPLEEPYWEVSSHKDERGPDDKILRTYGEKYKCTNEKEALLKVNELSKELNKETIEEISNDRKNKPFLYYSCEKIKNPIITKIYTIKNLGIIDLRKIEDSHMSVYYEFTILQQTKEDEGFFNFNTLGFILMIKNVKELTSKDGIATRSDKAIYKIIGPSGEIVSDDIQGYTEANKIYVEKTNEYKKVVEEEFNKINTQK